MSSNKKSSAGTNTNKDVIYIDVDDEITALIEKVRGSDKKIVALVLPKRATVLQSVVNMKLLKRAADQTKKNVVLITAESGLLPLAGSVGIHVAKSLSSKPEVPEGPERFDDKPETVEETSVYDESVDGTKTVGELSGDTAKASSFAKATEDGSSDDPDEPEETIELDNEDSADDTATSEGKTAKGKHRKFRIPNFNKFRLVLVLGVVGLFLLGGAVYAAVVVMPKASIVIKTDSTAVSASTAIQLKTTPETALDAEKGVAPVQLQEVKKTLTQQVPATGSVNNGEKATGSVEMTGKDCVGPLYSPPSDVLAGSGISSGGNTYITQEKATFSGAGFSGGCLNYSTGSIDITAQTGGAKYNVTSVNFAVAGRTDISATGSASGGTDNVVKVVSQADIDSAKQKITAQDTGPIQQELRTALVGRDLYAIDTTFAIGTPETKTDVAVNAPAENVTVTQTINYTMLGVKQEDLEKIIAHQAEQKIDTKKQRITDFGLEEAVFSLQSVNPDGATVDIQATVVAGAQLDVNAIKKQVAGKKAGDAKELISANPGVTDVAVQYSPFWVNSIPTNTDKITVTVQKPQVKQDATADEP